MNYIKELSSTINSRKYESEATKALYTHLYNLCNQLTFDTSALRVVKDSHYFKQVFYVWDEAASIVGGPLICITGRPNPYSEFSGICTLTVTLYEGNKKTEYNLSEKEYTKDTKYYNETYSKAVSDLIEKYKNKENEK